MIDWQSAFNLAAGILGAIGGWYMKAVWDGLKEQRESLSELERRLPETYARRDDVSKLADRLDKRFDRVEELLLKRTAD